MMHEKSSKKTNKQKNPSLLRNPPVAQTQHPCINGLVVERKTLHQLAIYLKGKKTTEDLRFEFCLASQ